MNRSAECGVWSAEWRRRSAVALMGVCLAAGLSTHADDQATNPDEGTESTDSALRTPNSALVPFALEPSATDERPPRKLFTGKVVLLPDALKKRGITSYKENDGQVVLETFDGRLFPIVSDWRGRAFFQDERLRNRKVELVCYQREGVPYLQVLAVFTFDERDRRQFTDYWCDICAIPMYEVKPCDCCQDPIRLRFQPQGLPDYLTGDARIPIGRAKPREDGAP